MASGRKTWRTAFLTLRDETLSLPSGTSVLDLLRSILFSQCQVLISNATDLPNHEVTSDIMFLLELTLRVPEGKDLAEMFIDTCHLIHDVSSHTRLEMGSSSWSTMIEFFEKMVLFLLKIENRGLTEESVRVKSLMETLDILRYYIHMPGRTCLDSENFQQVKLLCHIVSCCQIQLFPSCQSRNSHPGDRTVRHINLWEAQTTAFNLIGDIIYKLGTSVSFGMWQFTLEMLRKTLDLLASKNMILEDSVLSRFYVSLLNCLHLVLSEPKGSISDHVASLVVSLQMFFMYGLSNHTHPLASNSGHKEKSCSSFGQNFRPENSREGNNGRYQPPHLRRKGKMMQSRNDQGSQTFPFHEPDEPGLRSSDSENSDNDGWIKDTDHVRSSKTRVAAIVCLKDLCQADPKSLTTHWTLLLPTDDVLQLRRYKATLMTCLLFDPVLKVRLASASTLSVMLGGPSSVFLQVAEYRETNKCGSYTTLSITLGHILMQLHAGILHLIKYETHVSLLASLLKILGLLISATPFARMPGQLLPTVISSLLERVVEGFSSKTEQTSLQASGLSCLASALSLSPPSPIVAEMIKEELLSDSADFVGAQKSSCLLSILIEKSQELTHPTLSFEALQALKALSHNYSNVMDTFWKQVSAMVHGLLRVTSTDGSKFQIAKWPGKGDHESHVGVSLEKCVMQSIKVLDECLRAASGFKGTYDHLDDRLLDSPFISDSSKTRKISSAPSFELYEPKPIDNSSVYRPGRKEWSEALEKHLPLTLFHGSAMVRAAAITCFAGITSFVFFSLTKEKQDFILSSITNAALNDEIPSVRSAACRAIGVISMFPQIFYSAQILNTFIHAIEINTHNSLGSVRITASWALANICDSLRHEANDFYSEKSPEEPAVASRTISLLAECALRLTRDGDKIKSNAVRALGYLARFVKVVNPSEHGDTMYHMNSTSEETKLVHGPNSSTETCKPIHFVDTIWLERMVQAFVSCVTTGNVKVQWNVCHALGNLFLNETLRLGEMTWAVPVYSILLLLLRDSTNFKIRIHAAIALSVPTSRLDYGSSFSDVVQSLQHILETLGSHQLSSPSDFTYKATLEKQLTSSTLHVLGLVSNNDSQPLREFLVKKASFFEQWFKSLCLLLSSGNNYQIASGTVTSDICSKQKTMIVNALNSLLDVYKHSKQQTVALRFEKLLESLS